jgi:hypothetical protein
MSPPGPLLSPTVCEIWKWIIIVTAVPVVLFRLSDIAFVWVGRGRWEVGGSRWNAWLAWVNRRMRLWWLGVGILVFRDYGLCRTLPLDVAWATVRQYR